MKIDPQVKKLLPKLNNQPAMDTTSVEKARLSFSNNRVDESVAIPVNKVINMSIPGQGTNVDIRMYFPDGEGPFPAFIYFHGGGFVLGNLEMNDGLCRLITNEANCVVISVDYRLAPEHKFPAAIEDAIATVDWVNKNGESYNIDISNLAVGGQSAGGNLAAVSAYVAKEKEIKLTHQILVYPFIDFSFNNDSHKLFEKGYGFTTDQAIWYCEQYLRTSEDKLNPLASPFNIKDLSGLPKALVITAELDPVRDEGKKYAEYLQSAGVEVEYKCYEGVIHPFLSMWDKIDKGKEAAMQISKTLRHSFATNTIELK